MTAARGKFARSFWLSRVTALGVTLLFGFGAIGLSQSGVKELPVEKPRERGSNEGPKLKPPTRHAPQDGTVFVLLSPIVQGSVVVKNSAGKVVKQEDTDREGQAAFSLPRGQTYQVEASSPGFSSGTAVVKPAAAPAIVRVQLSAQSRVLKLQDLPAGAQVFLDNKPVVVTNIGGIAAISDVSPRKHTLSVRHPEFNEYKVEIDLTKLGIGESSTLYVTLAKVARLTIHSVAGADVMIDGVMQGRIPASGTMTIEYPISQPAEHAISAEKPGYITKSIREQLSAGAKAINLDLEPFANPEGASDGFDNLNQWLKAPGWNILNEPSNRKLQIGGTKLGLLKDKVYKDFQAVFTLWIPDGGATWAMRADEAGQNYYLFHLSGPRSTTHIPNRFYTYVVRNGKEPVEVNTPTPLVVDLKPNVSFLIHIVARGYSIEHSITSNETGEKVTLGRYTDSSPTKDKFLYGLFGFRSFGTETFVVDDFTIDPSTETVKTRP